MVYTYVYGKDERCEFRIYGEQDRTDETTDEGIEVGMELRVLIVVYGTAHFGKGIETMLAHLGAADAAVDGPDDRVGRMEIRIPWATGHIGEE